MKNKYIKLFIIAIITMFISIVPTYAKEVTLESKGNERDTFDFIINRENPDAAYVYLIGKYAFTSAHEMGLQDMMLAARSIQLTEGKLKDKEIPEKLDNMTIYLFKHASGSTEWKSQIVVGKTQLPEKFNVKYIDYHYVKKDKKVDTDEMVKTAMEKISTEMFNVKNEKISENEVTIDIETEKLKEKIVKGMGSGVFTALTSLVENTKVESITFEYNGVAPLTIDSNNLDSSKMVEWLNNNSQAIFGKNVSDLILADLLDREFKATINLGESEKNSYVSKKSATPNESYTIKFTGKRQKVDTDEIANGAFKDLKSSIFDFDSVTFEKGTATVKIQDGKLQENIVKGMNSGVTKLLKTLISNENVESIDFIYNTGSEEIKYTLKENFDEAELINWFNDNCKKIFNYEVGEAKIVDLINKSFKAKINLKNYAEKKEENPTEYTIKFDGQLPVVDSEAILNDAMSRVNKKFFEKDDSRSSGQTIVIKVKEIETTIEKGMNSGIYPILEKLSKTQGIQSVDFSYNDNVKFTLDHDTDFSKMLEWFNQNKKQIFEKDTEITLADLHNKTFTVTLNVGRVGKLKDTDKKTYEIKLLKTHEVTFHDDKAKAPLKEKEVVSVYDNEPIPEEEVTKRSKRSTDVVTDVFLGWYEEIEEGEDKEDKFNFETPITEDMELDAHWGTKFTPEEQQKVTKATQSALDIINSHSHEGKLKVDVSNGKIIITNMGDDNPSLVSMLTGSGVLTAMTNLLDTNKTNIVSLTMKFESDDVKESADIDTEVLDDPYKFVASFDDIYKKGMLITSATWKDLSSFINNLKVKVNLKDGKVFDDENNGEYTFELKNKQ